MTSKQLKKIDRALAKRTRKVRQDHTERDRVRVARTVLGDLIRATRHLERMGRVQG